MKPTVSLILSLKPEYADLIFNGKKEVEFRKRFPMNDLDYEIFVYVSSPVKQIFGAFRVNQVIKAPPEEIWHKMSKVAGIDKSRFDAYFLNHEIAYALKITNIRKFNSPVNMEILRREFDKFVIPQSWRILKSEELEFFSAL